MRNESGAKFPKMYTHTHTYTRLQEVPAEWRADEQRHRNEDWTNSEDAKRAPVFYDLGARALGRGYCNGSSYTAGRATVTSYGCRSSIAQLQSSLWTRYSATLLNKPLRSHHSSNDEPVIKSLFATQRK